MTSQLLGIITRLQSLQDSPTGEPLQRFFEVQGEKRCSVKFFDKTNTYELEVYEKGEKPQSYQFDNIDMIAIEIFDLLQL
ncbi:YkuJ family protein [Metabacillus fastidiosus]|uniref:YkuJ family protein n=1 Tax=Metabacillus fastidiosus TaxID=1458 RepID=A0ABU6P4B6_9BACI|nr:YkuJ family protein [Metabacillus fastidiosus]MEC2075190.1 YkuJ family protein [Metabacillus fastidiosus]MED4403773.1 YkuJ family protein [Metabacillus fastidiosus]MED4452552.1 YkuJ family protein [Metabacillus fastidiosus]MED4463517.1 YkuJ family protein [Metabacillus fastidiosus]MED4532877.1 YkuJ family protein [Metabacillus fastidiosus]